jgi:hypothetical protein
MLREEKKQIRLNKIFFVLFVPLCENNIVLVLVSHEDTKNTKKPIKRI